MKNDKVYYKPKVVILQIAYCPVCNKPIQEVTNVDAKIIMTWHCNSCHYSE